MVARDLVSGLEDVANSLHAYAARIDVFETSEDGKISQDGTLAIALLRMQAEWIQSLAQHVATRAQERGDFDA